MRKCAKQILAAGLSACVMFTMIPTELSYAKENTADIVKEGLARGFSGECGDSGSSVKWQYSDGKLTITGTGVMKDYDYNTPWYSIKYDIKEVEIGEGITNIGEAAFYGCMYLEKATLPKTMKKIGKGAFANCYNLREVNLSNAITEVGDYAFQSCALKEVNLPSTIKSLSPLAFYGCNEIESFSISTSNSTYKTTAGVLFSKNGKTLYQYPAGKTVANYVIPSSVTKVGKCAFLKADVSVVTIPRSVTVIEESAFQQSKITQLTIPESVTKIGSFLCYECPNLAKVVIKPGLAALSYEAFRKCGALTSVSLGKVKDLDYLAFSECTSLEKITIPKGVTTIGNGSFGECTSLKSVVIPSTVKEIAYQAFLNCKSLSKISFAEGLKIIHPYSFAGCKSLKSVTLPSTVTEIGEKAFSSVTKMNNKSDDLAKLEDGSYMRVAKVKIKVRESYKKSFEVLKIVNAERKKQGLKALKMDKKLVEAAMLRAAETSICWEHTRPTGRRCFTASEYMSGENIALGSATAKEVMALWMNSPGHRANILGSRYTTIGIGCIEIGGSNYWVQCFGETGSFTVKSTDYKDRNKTRTINVSTDKEYYRPDFQIYNTTVEAGGNQKIYTYWNNGYTQILLDSSYINYSSSDESICTVSKGTIKGLNFGTAKIKIWFPGYEKGAVTKKITVKGGTPVKLKTYTAKFSANGGTKLSRASKKIVTGKTIGTLPTVRRKGYTLKGWYTKKSGGSKISAKTRIKKNQTFYARWQKVSKPAGTDIISLSSKPGTAMVGYKKVSGVSGYEICYSTGSKFAKSSTKRIRTKLEKKTITSLRKGKTYYIKVRSYRTDSAGNKIYGSYSAAKKIKIR